MIEEHPPIHRLDKTVIQYDKTSSLVIALFYMIGCAGLVRLIYWFKWSPLLAIPLVLVIILIFCIDYFVLPYLRFKSIRYEVHPTYLEILKGVFFRTREIIPIERIQQILVEDGPISRRYHVKSVEIETAGTSHTIPLLLEDEAYELKSQTMALMKEVRADV